MIRNRLLINFALFLLVAAIAAYFVFSGSGETPGERLTTLTPEAVTRIEIAHNGGVPIVRLERREQRWHFAHLAGFDADTLAELSPNLWLINSILAITQIHSLQSTPAMPGALEQFGLLAPIATVSFNGVALHFGDTAPLSKKRYVMRDDRVYVIDEHVLRHLIAEPVEFVSRELVAGNHDIIALTLPDHRLLRDEKGLWQITPQALPISQDQLNGYVDQWRYAQALRTRLADKVAAEKIIDLRFRNGKTLQFGLTETGSTLELTRLDNGIVYQFPLDVGKRLLTPALSAQADR